MGHGYTAGNNIDKSKKTAINFGGVVWLIAFLAVLFFGKVPHRKSV